MNFPRLLKLNLLSVFVLAILLSSSSSRNAGSSMGERALAGPTSVVEPSAMRRSLRVTNQNFLNYLHKDLVLPDDSDEIGLRILSDYGAMFVVPDHIKVPSRCIFANEQEVQDFQNQATFVTATIGGVKIDLQPAAMNALLAARDDARRLKLDITPRGGSEAARRSYADTVRLWYTRVSPALRYWQKRGRLTREQVQELQQLSAPDQVSRILQLEKNGIFFSQDLSKSILYSIAAPGSSQHIAMLALDVSQFSNEQVRRILAKHGWFQTVYSDLPHFTYLGLSENDLSMRGLQAVKLGNQVFWIPTIKD